MLRLLILLPILLLAASGCADAQQLVEHGLLKSFSLKSELLSGFHGKDVTVRAAVLLPGGYADHPERRYPVRYNVAGYGGRFTRVNKLVEDEAFMKWYEAGNGPQVITVFLDGEGPYGDPYQLDSDNSGPYGRSLIEEIIPAIDAGYRTRAEMKYRFTDGCSTGGWVSLALQLLYPDTFGGVYSYSPDPVTFRWMQLVDMYQDTSAFYNSKGYLVPTRRSRQGEPLQSIRSEVAEENEAGKSGTYLDGKGQWGAWNALYSPKGTDGLPAAAFDPLTGRIDPAVVEHWKRYDLLFHLRDNWTTLGPKLAGKVYVWMGDMDNYYLNNALRDFDAFLRTTSNPESDAKIEFTATMGHCDRYNHRRVLEQITDRLDKMDNNDDDR